MTLIVSSIVNTITCSAEIGGTALVLHHLADLSVAEVARELEVPEGTIKARLSRGRAALAELLRDDLENARD